MTKIALVIGSQTQGLQGVERDVQGMSEALGRRGFIIRARTGDGATRAGILQAYDDLIREAVSKDVVVVYYSGHGALVTNPEHEAAVAAGRYAPRYFQHIVPTDYDPESKDFRGIVSYELSARLARLTEKTQNVTVILDCCHSAQMSRDAFGRGAIARALPRPTVVDARAFMDALRQEGVDFSQLHLEGNPHAVRLVAAGQTQAAWEYANEAGQQVGLFTESLLWVLNQTDADDLTWETVGGAVRERVLRTFPQQRPEIEGPANRVIFSLDQPALTGGLAVVAKDGEEAMLRGGQIVGVTKGDVYAIMPINEARADTGKAIAVATVKSVAAVSSNVSLAFRNGHAVIPDGARAFVLERALPRRPVVIDAEGEARRAFVDAVKASPVVDVAGDAGRQPVLARVQVRDGRIAVADAAGELFPPVPYEPKRVQDVVEVLRKLAVAQSMRELDRLSAPGDGTLLQLPPTSLEIEWGCVEDGALRPLPLDGETMCLGDKVYVKATNRAHARRYLHVFNVGVRGDVTRLTGTPRGIPLDRDEPYVLGQQEDGTLVGMNLKWPEDLPRDQTRRDEVVVILTEAAEDLGALQTTIALGQRKVTRGPGSVLGALMNQVHIGGTRDMNLVAAPDRFIARRIEFLLNPVEGRAARSHDFLIDLRPRALTPTGAAARGPKRIAIRLTDVIIHANRAFGDADIRIDSLVVTRPNAGEPAYRVDTIRVPRVGDGDRLPLDNVLIFAGDVQDYVDVCVWVSRDRRDTMTLLQLLETRLTSQAFQSATAALLAATAATVTPWTAAVGASAVLARIVYELLAAAVGKSIGLYRTSLLSTSNFDLGRHPHEGTLQAQDFSFAYHVEEL